MSKLVKINDRKPIEIYIGRKTRGPISGIRLSEEVIARILRSVDAPRDMYAIGPNNMLVKLTLDNYMKTEEELFSPKSVTPVIDEEEAKAKAEALRKSLEAKKMAESEAIKTEDVKSEVTESVVKEEVAETVEEPEAQIEEKVEEKVEETVEETKTEDDQVASAEENTAEVSSKNNYNKYNNYNKNHKNKR